MFDTRIAISNAIGEKKNSIRIFPFIFNRFVLETFKTVNILIW